MGKSEPFAHIAVAFIPGVLGLMIGLPGVLTGIIIILIWIFSRK